MVIRLRAKMSAFRYEIARRGWVMRGVRVRAAGVSVGFGAFALLGLLAGCASPSPYKTVATTPQAQSSQTPIPPVKSPMSRTERDRILLVLELLDSADQAVKQKRLVSPRGDSAVEYYQQVLKLVPGYEEAEQGLTSILDRLLNWSDAAMQQGRLDKARYYLAQARRIDADNPRIAEAAGRLKQAGGRDGGYTRLDRAQLKTKSTDLVEVLVRLADRIRAENARVVIEAPSDSQGRWIYQQLNQRHEEYRIRANLRIDPQPGIRLLY